MLKSIDFLPAVLTLEQKSPPKLVRLTLYVFIAVLISGITWAMLGKLEVIAPLQGVFIAPKHSKIMQSIRLAHVDKILVKEGDFVHQGQILITLNPDLIENEALKLKTQQQFYEEKFKPNNNIKQLEILEYHALQEKLSFQLLQIDMQIQGVKMQIEKLNQNQKFNVDKEQSYEKLMKEEFVSAHAYWEKQQIMQETTQDIKIQKSRLQELTQQQKSIISERKQAQANWHKLQLKEQQDNTQALALNDVEISRNAREQQDWQIIAPIDGFIQDLQVHHEKAVLQPGQNIVTIVPQLSKTLQIEALMENKDVGFIKIGQQARIKIDAFPYTRYGTLEGKVIEISHDVVGSGLKSLNPQRNNDYQGQTLEQNQSPKYRIKLQTFANQKINSKNIKAGMQVSAEIHTGKRSVMSYFLSPLLETTDESLGER